jgi:hypothetical protein
MDFRRPPTAFSLKGCIECETSQFNVGFVLRLRLDEASGMMRRQTLSVRLLR